MARTLIPLMTLVLMAAGCGKSPAPGGAEPSKAAGGHPEGKAAPVEAPPPATPAPDAGQAPEVQAPAPEADQAATVDREALARCYTAVYCAQKKGEMSRILSIYKEFGFETPQAFTKAWIEAAKDTEWVTRMAYDVSKKCP